MRSKFQLVILLCYMAIAVRAQNGQSALLDIGSPAPPLRVREWLRGNPIQDFEKGKVYVVEFWASWCGPCIEEMPRLSALARKYRGTVSVIGINVYERRPYPLVKSFVDSMGRWMDYNVATQDSNYMETDWLDGIGESAIPTSIVVDAAGRLAWIGYPSDLEDVLPRILGNNWDMKEAMAERHTYKRLRKLGREAFTTLNKYTSNGYMKDFFGEPDSSLLLINELVGKEPGLKYERFIAFSTMHTLLRINPHKAYEYGRMMLSQKDPSYDAIIGPIQDFPYLYNTLPAEIFELGAEACQRRIDLYPWTAKTPKNYFKMSEWYLRANNQPKAKQAMRKAIKALKRKKKLLFEKTI